MIYEWMLNQRRKLRVLLSVNKNYSDLETRFDNVPAGFTGTIGSLFFNGLKVYDLTPVQMDFGVWTQLGGIFPEDSTGKLEFSGDFSTEGDFQASDEITLQDRITGIRCHLVIPNG